MNMRSQLGHVGRYTCNNATWRADTCSDLDNSDRSDEWVDIDTGQLDLLEEYLKFFNTSSYFI